MTGSATPSSEVIGAGVGEADIELVLLFSSGTLELASSLPDVPLELGALAVSFVSSQGSSVAELDGKLVEAPVLGRFPVSVTLDSTAEWLGARVAKSAPGTRLASARSELMVSSLLPTLGSGARPMARAIFIAPMTTNSPIATVHKDRFMVDPPFSRVYRHAAIREQAGFFLTYKDSERT